MSEIRATTISDSAGTGPITLTGQYAAKAWVNFNGTSTVAIRNSANVSSITDNGTGSYTVNYSTAMADANYSAFACAGGSASGNFTAWARLNSGTPLTTTSVSVVNIGLGTGGSTYTNNDQSEFSVLVML